MLRIHYRSLVEVSPISICITLCCLLFGASSWAADSVSSVRINPIDQNGKTIRSVSFSGKFKLRRYILYREIDSEPGHPFSSELLERDRRKVDGFGIFSRVDTQVTPVGDSVDIDFSLREVWTLLPLVGLGRTDGKLDWSIGVHERNLLGFYLQAVVLYRRYEGRNSGHIATTFPRFLGKDIAVGFAIAEKRETDPLSSHGVRYEYDYLHKAVSGSLGHRLAERVYISGSAGYDRENWSLITRDTLGIAVQSLDYPRYFVGAGLTLGRVYFDRYFYVGNDISGDVTGISERSSGKFNSWRAGFTARKYVINGPLNFALRARLQTSSADERAQPFAISGEVNVRGYREKEERGDHALTANFESRWRTLDTRVLYSQLVGFVDYGIIWGRGKPFEETWESPYWSLGVGIRGSIKQFLGRVGRIDVAFNPHNGFASLYVSTSQFF